MTYVPRPLDVIFTFFNFYFICKSVLPECSIYIMYVPGAQREQKRVLNTLDLELRRDLSHCLGAGN